jgi:hypothetical protein
MASLHSVGVFGQSSILNIFLTNKIHIALGPFYKVVGGGINY